jgi:RNA polymerase sigma factor (sigma-70 family)
VFYLREYPKVVGLLYGLLVSRLVAEELAQETFLVADRDWGRISGLDNPRAWVRRVAINQRGSFLRAYLRQQTRERDAVVRDEEDSIKLADEHAEVWQAVRTLPPLQAQVIALHYYEDYSVAQADAAAGLREILRRTGQLVAHGRTTTLPDRPQEPPEPIPPSPLRQAPPRRTPQRLALVVNLLVLALGIVIGVAATYTQDANGSASPAAAPHPIGRNGPGHPDHGSGRMRRDRRVGRRDHLPG